MRTIFPALFLAFVATGCGGSVDASSDTTLQIDAGTTPQIDAGAHPVDASPQDMDAAKPEASSPPTVPPAKQEILFEMSYVNYAWAPVVSGFFVTVDGSVYEYDYYKSSPDAGDPFVSLIPGMTREQVTSKYGPSPKLVTKVDIDTLHQRYSLMEGARKGTLLWQYLCADAGEVRYVAYGYDPASSTYTPVLLGSSGDRAVKNTAPEGGELMAWLGTLGSAGFDFCDYRIQSCDKELCDGTPSCSIGEVPIGQPEEACYTYCQHPASCEHVASCQTCVTAGASCVVDQLGLAHCLYQPYGCSDGITCECAGDQICAGGKSFCQGDQINGLRCVP